MAKPITYLAIALLLAHAASASLYSAAIIDSTGDNTSLYFDTSSDAYADNVANVNPDVKLKIYGTTSTDVANKYVGAVYASGTEQGALQYTIITTAGGDNPLTETGSATSCGTGCYEAETDMSIVFAAIIVGEDAGNAGAAFFPARPFIVISPDNHVDSTDTFIPLDSTNGILKGSISISRGAYNQNTGNVSLDVTGATGTTTTGSVDILSEQSGYATKEFITIGICEDSHGRRCSGTARVSIDESATSLSTGIKSPADTNTATRYAVANGQGAGFCIGPDVDATSITSNASNVLPGTTVNITATIRNQNRVDVTQSFNVTLYANGLAFATRQIDGLSAQQTKTVSSLYDTTGMTSGSISLRAHPQDSTIGDCNQANDNATGTLNLKKVNLIKVLIDGNETRTFPYPGRPYNVTIRLNDTDGTQLAGITVRIIEKNGISLFSPLQTFQQGGVVSKSTAEVITDSNGTASLILIPTGNRLYLPEFSYMSVSEHVGNYSLAIEAYSGSRLQFLEDGQEVSTIPLSLSDMSVRQPEGNEMHSKDPWTKNNHIESIYTYVHQVYSAVKNWLVP